MSFLSYHCHSFDEKKKGISKIRVAEAGRTRERSVRSIPIKIVLILIKKRQDYPQKGLFGVLMEHITPAHSHFGRIPFAPWLGPKPDIKMATSGRDRASRNSECRRNDKGIA